MGSKNLRQTALTGVAIGAALALVIVIGYPSWLFKKDAAELYSFCPLGRSCQVIVTCSVDRGSAAKTRDYLKHATDKLLIEVDQLGQAAIQGTSLQAYGRDSAEMNFACTKDRKAKKQICVGSRVLASAPEKPRSFERSLAKTLTDQPCLDLTLRSSNFEKLWGKASQSLKLTRTVNTKQKLVLSAKKDRLTYRVTLTADVAAPAAESNAATPLQSAQALASTSSSSLSYSFSSTGSTIATSSSTSSTQGKTISSSSGSVASSASSVVASETSSSSSTGTYSWSPIPAGDYSRCVNSSSSVSNTSSSISSSSSTSVFGSSSSAFQSSASSSSSSSSNGSSISSSYSSGYAAASEANTANSNQTVKLPIIPPTPTPVFISSLFNCSQREPCSEGTLRCVPESDLKGAAGLCSDKSCVINLSKFDCLRLGLDPNYTTSQRAGKLWDIARGFGPTPPDNLPAIDAACTLWHEMTHLQQDMACQPDCQLELDAYNAGAACYQSYFKKLCLDSTYGTEPFCQSLSDRMRSNLSSAQFQSCRCASSRTCQTGPCEQCLAKCKSAGGNAQTCNELSDLYCLQKNRPL